METQHLLELHFTTDHHVMIKVSEPIALLQAYAIDFVQDVKAWKVFPRS